LVLRSFAEIEAVSAGAWILSSVVADGGAGAGELVPQLGPGTGIAVP
jgi:hypothetical protein